MSPWDSADEAASENLVPKLVPNSSELSPTPWTGSSPLGQIRSLGYLPAELLIRRSLVRIPAGAFIGLRVADRRWWYRGGTLRYMPTAHPRIQITEDHELTAALRAAAPHLPAGLPRSRQVRELAITGARHLSGELVEEGRRQELLEQLAQSFEEPEASGLDWDLLRDGKPRAWPLR